MDRIRNLFLLLALVAPLHVAEQLAFGTGEIVLTDRATEILLTVVGAGVLLLAYGLLAGGMARLGSTAVFAVLAVFESHHMVATFLGASYTPGVVSAVPLVATGVMLLVAVRAEYRRTQVTWADVTPAYEIW